MSHAATTRGPETPIVVNALLRLFALPLAGITVFVVVVAIGLRPDRIPLLAVTMLLVTAILCFITLDRLRPLEQRNLLMSLFSFAYLMVLVMPVFVFYLGDAGYMPEHLANPVPLTPRAVMYGVIAATVGYVALLVGYLFPVGGAVARFVPQMRREWSHETTLVVALVIIPIGWAVRLASELHLIPERAGSGVLGALVYFMDFGIALLALSYYRYRSRAALLLLLTFLPPTMIFGFFTGSKSAVLRPMVMVVVVHILDARRLRAWWVVGFLLVMAFFYPISEVYRGYAWGRKLSAVEVIANPGRVFRIIERFSEATTTTEHLESGFAGTTERLNGLGILSVIVRDAGTRVPFQGGWTIGYVPLSFVPRLVWSGKPKFETGQWVTSHFGPGPEIESSTGATWIGEFYYNFGWPGVAIGMFVLGIWFRFLQESFLRVNSSIPCMFAGVVTIVGLCTAIDGDLLSATNSVVFNVAPIVLIHVLVCFFTAPPRRVPQAL